MDEIQTMKPIENNNNNKENEVIYNKYIELQNQNKVKEEKDDKENNSLNQEIAELKNNYNLLADENLRTAVETEELEEPVENPETDEDKYKNKCIILTLIILESVKWFCFD